MTSEVRTLGELAEWGSGGTPKRSRPEYFGAGVPWVSIADLNDGVVAQAKESLTPLGLEQSSAKLVPAGSVLVAMYGSIGKLGIAGTDLCTSQAIAFAKPKPRVLDTRYLFHFLLSERPKLLSRGRGGTQMNIGQADLKSWPIPLPPLMEQRRIAGILDQADELRAQRRKAITLLDELPQAIFTEMFVHDGDVEFVESTVADVAAQSRGAIRTGPFGSQLLHSEFVDSGVPVLGIDNAVNNEFEWGKSRFISDAKYTQLQRYTVLPGDVLITIMGTTGRCAVVPDDIPIAINTKHLCCITLDQSRCLPSYLHAYFLLHPRAGKYLDKTSKGAIMAGLNMGIIKEMPILLPPSELQREFEDRIESVRQLKTLHLTSLAQLDALFASLQFRAFRGEL